ncbi:MAG: NAD(P)H-dependent oxidoreductase [Deltaproteobacteria bacterium]|nr:NAD(P)H-dependent oxidoreductase [Deltaproteobacteria bacterium]
MFVLGLQGSPRKKGNTASLLSTFLEEAAKRGAHTRQLDVARMHIDPCQECGTCDRKGFCPLEDDMQEVYHLLWKADLIVMATPMFFYGPTAQLKALIDRSQALWARKYTHKLTDPGRKWRKGFLLAVGATKGKNLFEGTQMTAKYFFDAVGAHFEGTLGYRMIEHVGDIDHHPTAFADAREKAAELIEPELRRKQVLFVCRENACRSQMASGFAQFYFGDRLDVESAGSAPAAEINADMIKAMSEKGIDMAYRKPTSLEAIQGVFDPALMVSMGCEDACPLFPGVRAEEWDIPDPAGKGIAFMREIRDALEKRVNALFADTGE